MKYFLSSLDHNDPKIVDFTMFHTMDLYNFCMDRFYHDEPLSEASNNDSPDVTIYFLDTTLFEAIKNPSQIPFGVSVLIDPEHIVFVCLAQAQREFQSNIYFKMSLESFYSKYGNLSDDELCAVYTAKWLSDGLFTYLHGDNV